MALITDLQLQVATSSIKRKCYSKLLKELGNQHTYQKNRKKLFRNKELEICSKFYFVKNLSPILLFELRISCLRSLWQVKISKDL